jgi:hypothetical protein
MLNLPLGELLKSILSSSGPNRDLDREIAFCVGFEKKEEHDKTVWLSPDGVPMRRLPAFTGSVERARQLAELVSPAHVGGVTWGSLCQARMNNSDPCVAATAALALCGAAVQELRFKEGS